MPGMLTTATSLFSVCWGGSYSEGYCVMACVGQGEPRTHGGVGGGQREHGAAGLECLRLLREFVVGDGRDFGRAGNIQGGPILGAGDCAWGEWTTWDHYFQLSTTVCPAAPLIESVSSGQGILPRITHFLCAQDSFWNTLRPFSSLQPCPGWGETWIVQVRAALQG